MLVAISAPSGAGKDTIIRGRLTSMGVIS